MSINNRHIVAELAMAWPPHTKMPFRQVLMIISALFFHHRFPTAIRLSAERPAVYDGNDHYRLLPKQDYALHDAVFAPSHECRAYRKRRLSFIWRRITINAYIVSCATA